MAPATRPAIVFSGGMALGAFHGGAYAAMAAAGWQADWLVGTSIGAVTAGLIAGGPPDGAVGRLRSFWAGVASEPGMLLPAAPWMGSADMDALSSWWAALRSQSFGRAGMFAPRPPSLAPDHHPSLYDLSPLRARLDTLIDFGALNDGPTRVAVSATDVATGERVVFDTRRGARLGVDHLLAASALMPLFPPIEIGSRLLADGGLSANLPVDLVLDAPDGHDCCVAVDLFAPEGGLPDGVLAAGSRALDLMFGNPSRAMLDQCVREQALRAAIARLGERLPPGVREEAGVAADLAEGRAEVVRLIAVGFRAGPGEAGPLKGFDFSGRSLAARWEAGAAALLAAMGDG